MGRKKKNDPTRFPYPPPGGCPGHDWAWLSRADEESWFRQCMTCGMGQDLRGDGRRCGTYRREWEMVGTEWVEVEKPDAVRDERPERENA